LSNNCFVSRRGAAGRWPIRNRTIALGLSLVALPTVFLLGLWTRGAVAPALRESVSGGSDVPTQNVQAQIVAARDRNREVAKHFAQVPAALPRIAADIDGNGMHAAPANQETQSAVVAGHRPPKPSTIAANLDADARPFRQVQTPMIEAAPDSIDGFALRSPVAGQFVADVQVPRNSWFSTASATADCESGTCKLIPLKTADRKLNTALEWSATPELAVEQAAREGKLVFLIHVSGNFAQPGFT
jgi:hypothetical protein